MDNIKKAHQLDEDDIGRKWEIRLNEYVEILDFDKSDVDEWATGEVKIKVGHDESGKVEERTVNARKLMVLE